jgi:predicted hydrolase (HD superfamily)
MSTITREEAWGQLTAWTETDSLLRHARAVEITMRAAALAYGPGKEAAECWGIAGMLHDADYEKWPEEHPNKIVSWLRERDEPELAHAVSAHYTQWNVPYESAMDRALVACDELTGFIMACCYLRPDGITSLKPKSVKKKLKDKKFAAGVERHEVIEGARMLEVELTEHIQMLIDALKPHAAELRIEGKGPED